jgi:hypothetical protein
VCNRFIRGSLVTAAGVLAACHNNAGRQGAAPVRRDGAYDYVARVNGRPFDGVLHVVSDTLVLEPREGACYYDPASVSTTTIRYKCTGSVDADDFVLVFDRHDPVSSSYWTASTYKDVQHRVCDKYSTDSNGRSTCVTSHIETELRLTTITGTLTMRWPKP